MSFNELTTVFILDPRIVRQKVGIQRRQREKGCSGNPTSSQTLLNESFPRRARPGSVPVNSSTSSRSCFSITASRASKLTAPNMMSISSKLHPLVSGSNQKKHIKTVEVPNKSTNMANTANTQMFIAANIKKSLYPRLATKVGVSFVITKSAEVLCARSHFSDNRIRTK